MGAMLAVTLSAALDCLKIIAADTISAMLVNDAAPLRTMRPLVAKSDAADKAAIADKT